MNEDLDDTVIVPSRRISPRQEDIDEDTVVPTKPAQAVNVRAAVGTTGGAAVGAPAENGAETRPPALVEPAATNRRRVPLTHSRLNETLRAPSAAREVDVLPPAVTTTSRPAPVVPVTPPEAPETIAPRYTRETAAPRYAPAAVPPLLPPVPIPTTPVSSAHGFRIGDRAPVSLDVPALIGRRPTAPRVPGKVFPRLVRVSSPLSEVSSTHVELRQEGSSVIVTDLRSTNGTIVRMPGSRPVKLRQGESIVVRPGTQVDIGDGNVLHILPPPRLTVPGDAGERGWS
ncbi:FHA domain-containing protein [Parafrigoribacterium soli]|uniref:FHA domain-containing protein n=1 Tax=Parafrigoribacterium soli TaxID=3144663 RepID=UPI0032EACE0A